METKKRTSKPSANKTDRKRGRPAGRNRVPLSLEERRARNAQYERERRNETAEAMAQLADAAGCDPQIANAELMATVINQLHRRANRTPPKHSIDDLKRINDNLELQIELLERRLAGNPNYDPQELNETGSCVNSSSSESETDSEPVTSEIERPTKCRKTTKRPTINTTTQAQRRPKNQSTSSNDSQDSVWSNHSDNTSQDELRTDSIERQPTSPTHYDSTSSNWATSSHEYDSDQSNKQEFRQAIAQDRQQVTVEIQLVPEQTFVASGHHLHRSENTYSDPFSDETERKVLESFGCEDPLLFETDSSGLDLNWPLSDYDDFRTSYT